MEEHRSPKLLTGVRFPPPVPIQIHSRTGLLVAYQITTQRGELNYQLTIDHRRSDAMDAAARGVVDAFETDSANDPSYGNQPAYSSISYVSEVITVTADTVPVTV